MWSRFTIIGVIIGGVIIGMGTVALVMHFGTITVTEEYEVPAGEFVSYVIPAPESTDQQMTITGSRYNVTLASPGDDGYRIQNAEYRDSTTLEWTHAESGDTTIHIRNTGAGDLLIEPNVARSSDPIWIAFDFMVMISGIVIIGFSLGFATRKPKGF